MNMMEMLSLSPYFLFAALFLLSIGFIGLAFRTKSTTADGRPLPPGRTGWPIIGENLKLFEAVSMGHPETFVDDRTSKYSPDVFRTSLFGENIAVFCGAPGNKFLFSSENKFVKTWWPRSVMRVLFDPEAKRDAKFNVKVREYIPEFLKPEPVKDFAPIMDSIARDHLAKHWFPKGQVKVMPLVKEFTFQVTCRIFLNIKDPRDIETLFASYANIMPGLISLPINIPGTRFNKGIEGGKKIRKQLIHVIRKRKDEIVKGKDAHSGDLVTKLIKESDANELEIAYTIISFIVASHESMTTAITLVLFYLAQFPDVYDGVYKEQMEVAKSKHERDGEGQPLTWEDIQKMPYSWNVASESMRISPPTQGSFREALTDFTFAGYTIPKGWKTYTTAYTTHNNPKYFPNPEKFDPTRFEGSGPAPFSYIPFGGGPRMCPGRGYARVELLGFVHYLVTRVRFEKVDPNEKILYTPTPAPSNGLLLRLIPHYY